MADLAPCRSGHQTRPDRSLEVEILILRHQLNIQRRHVPKRVAFSAMDRLVGLYRLVPNAIKALTIVKPDTVIRWHRAGFRSYWRWKSRNRCGRPTVLLEIRRLIREMRHRQSVVGSAENPWRASQAWHRDRPDQRRQVYGAEEGPSLAEMEDVPSQPCGWHLSQWISSSCRRSRSGCSMDCSSWAMTGGRSYGLG